MQIIKKIIEDSILTKKTAAKNLEKISFNDREVIFISLIIAGENPASINCHITVNILNRYAKIP